MAIKTRVGIVTVNYHGLDDTLECLRSLADVKTKHEVKVYVVNVAADDEAGRIDKQILRPVVIRLEENLGFSGANNVGMKRAIEGGAEVIVLLNNDTVVDKDFLDPLVTKALRKDVGLVSGKIYFYPGREFHRDTYNKSELGKVIWYAGGMIDRDNVYGYHRGVDEVDHGQFDEREETEFATGCCVAVAKKTIDQIGMLDDKYFFGLEDLDWSMRAKRAGSKVIYEPKSIIWHKNAGSSGGSGSSLHEYYHNRNRMLIGWRYAGWRAKAALMREGLKKLKTGSREEKMAVKDAWLNKYGKRDER